METNQGDKSTLFTDNNDNKGSNDNDRCISSRSSFSDQSSIPERGRWASQAEFILASVSYCVGFGNIWRFPYLCMRNGGGAFLIPYFASMFVCGIPLFFMECILGQFTGMGPLHVWTMCPLIKGVGWSMLLLSIYLAVYYHTVMAWVLYYLIKSFAKSLPWSDCNNWWNTPLCLVRSLVDKSNINGTDSDLSLQQLRVALVGNDTMIWQKIDAARAYANITANETIPWRSPSEEFWQNEVLRVTSGISDLGGMRWDLYGCLALGWLVVFLCICKGVKSLGKVVYVTALLPYVLLTVLLVRGLLLPGAIEGIKFYIVPDWWKLLELEVWVEACIQVFYSLGLRGGLVVLASYNNFNNNIARDAIVLPMINCLTSFYAGFVIFAVAGYLVHTAGLTMDDIKPGPGLAFIMYPEALAKMPISPMWAILFFLMLIVVGFDSQFGNQEVILTALGDSFPNTLRRRKTLVTAVVIFLQFLAGFIFCLKGGIYFFTLVDWYVAAFTFTFIAVIESLALMWVYGHERLFYDIELMLGHKPSFIWKICWGVICPLLLAVGSVYNLVSMNQPYYGEYHYPKGAIIFGWFFALSSFAPIPICFVLELLKQKGNPWKRLKAAAKPTAEWGPCDAKAKAEYKYTKSNLLDAANQFMLNETSTTQSKSQA